MTEKELKKLNRRELLELLVTQTRRNESMEKKLLETGEALEKREFEIKDSGSIAEAALKISGVFEAANEASKIYLENIKLLEEQTREKCEAAVRKAEAEADEILKRAKAEAENIISAAKAEAEAEETKVKMPEAKILKNIPKTQKNKSKKKKKKK